MRRIALLVGLLLAPVFARADSLTPRLGLLLLSTGTTNWGTKLNNSVFSVADSSAAAQFVPNNFISTNTFRGAVGLVNSSMSLTGPLGFIQSQSSITGNHFGNGAALTGIPSSGSIVGVYVRKDGDNIFNLSIGSAVAVTTISANGSIFVASNSSITLSGSSGTIVSGSSITGSHFGDGSALTRTYNVAFSSSSSAFSTTSTSFVGVTGTTATLTNVVAGNRIKVCAGLQGANGTNNQSWTARVIVGGVAVSQLCIAPGNVPANVTTACSGCFISAATAGGTVTASLQALVSGGTFTKETSQPAWVVAEEIK